MKKFFRPSTKNKEKPNDHMCANCGFDSRDRDSPEATEPIEVTDEHVQEAIKIVVDEAMKIFQPLLDKLDQASKQLKEEQGTGAAPGQAPNFEQQLANLMKTADKKQKLTEQRVAQKMQKMQSRFAHKIN